MLRRILADPELSVILSALDQELCEKAREKGCPLCAAALHTADYPRKPRCGKPFGQDWRRRLSLCCSREGCRKRVTPPSVRFLGRRLYPAVVVLLLTALVHGVSRRRATALRSALGVDRKTLLRWRTWWAETFPRTPFWKELAARFLPSVALDSLPLSLLDRFGSTVDRIVALLRFLAPLSTTTGERRNHHR